jgi:virginiamycin B lyase
MVSARNCAPRRRPRRFTFPLIVVIVGTVLTLPSSAGAYVYWANYGLAMGTTVGRADLGGTGVTQSFMSAPNSPTGVAVDDQHLYWTNPAVGTIGRANLDGTGANQFFVTTATSPISVAVDARHIYWTDGGRIGRANLDGSSVDDNFITGLGALSVAVDATHIYWSNTGGHAIGRANLDGSSPDQSFIDLSGAASGPNGVAVDGQHIYWTTAGAVGRADLSGKNVDLHFIATGDSNAYGVAVDGQHVYWANLRAGTIGRANLDGSSPEPAFISGASAPFGVAVDPLPEASATAVACAPAAVLPPAAAICTVTVTDTAGLNPPTGTVDFTASGAGSFGPPASCSLITIGAAQSTCQQTFAATAAGIDNITAAYRGDTFNTPSSSTATVTVLAAHPSAQPANAFALSRPKLNKRSGTATLIATVPGPGALLLTGRGIKKLTKSVRHPGRVQLTFTPQPDTSRKLGRTGRATVTVKVTYTPAGGDPNTEFKKLTLRRGQRRA